MLQQLSLSSGPHNQEVVVRLEQGQLYLSDAEVYAFCQIPDSFSALCRCPVPFMTDVVQIFCYLQTQVLYVILKEKTNADKGTSL